MTWVSENLASEGERVRGIIVVGRADKTLRSAVRQVDDRVLLKEYRIKMTFTDVQ